MPSLAAVALACIVGLAACLLPVTHAQQQQDFACTNGELVPAAAVLDGVCDCADGSDEPQGWCRRRQDAKAWGSHDCELSPGTTTIPLMALGGRRGLSDVPDRNGAKCVQTASEIRSHSMFGCTTASGGSEIPRAYVNDGWCDCADHSDELQGVCTDSCEGSCGSVEGTGVCFCDEDCTANGDCCSDYAAVC